MATIDVEQAILDGNTHKSIPLSVYESSLAPTYQSSLSSLSSSIINSFSLKSPIEFDPLIHLTYYANGSRAQKLYDQTRRLTMEQLGLNHKQQQQQQSQQISDIGVSDPFQLFTDEAITIMRQEVLQRDTFMKYARYSYNSTSGMDCVVRGFVKDGDEINCPFTYQAWTHCKTMELVSKMAGVELEIVMDYEIAHTNISMKLNDMVEEERIKHQRQLIDQESATSTTTNGGDDIPAVVGWHYDSYPFVCVLMLSDTTNMIGGETSLRMGSGHNGKVAIVPSPTKGSANVLQGRLIEHIAPSPVGMSERITMVTSYRAKSPMMKDTSVLSTVKPEVNYGSRYNQFYGEWIDYRIKLMQKKLDLINLNTKCDANSGKFNKQKTIEALKEVEEYLLKTYSEM